MLVKRHGQEQFDSYAQRREAVRERAAAYDAEALTGRFGTIYQFGGGLIGDRELAVNEKGIKVPGFSQEISLELPNRFSDMGGLPDDCAAKGYTQPARSLTLARHLRPLDR